MRSGAAPRTGSSAGRAAQPVGGPLLRKAEETAIAALSSSRHATRLPLHGAWAVGA